MKTTLRFCCVIALFLSVGAYCREGKMMMMHGGLGFLFPDANSFANPGQLSLNSDAALEAYYTRENLSQSQSIQPSLVWGNGHFGLGAFANRTSTNLTSPKNSVDIAGAAMGLGILHDHVTVGVGAERVIGTNQVNDGVVNASLTYNGARRMGFTAGVDVGTTINDKVKNAQDVVAGIGWGFGPNTSLEVNYALPSTSDTKNYVVSGAFTAGNEVFYLGTAYSYDKATTDGEVMGRLGVMLGYHVDFSVHAEKILKTGFEPSYGGSFRVAF